MKMYVIWETSCRLFISKKYSVLINNYSLWNINYFLLSNYRPVNLSVCDSSVGFAVFLQDSSL